MASDLKSTISISSLVELMTTGELIPSVKELFLELDGGMGTLRLSLEDDGGNALVLQESMANVLCLLKLERRKRKVAEALLKRSANTIDNEAMERRLSGDIGLRSRINELNNQIQNLERRSTKLVNALKRAKDDLEQSELVADLRQRDLQSATRSLDRVEMVVEDTLVARIQEIKFAQGRIDSIESQLENSAREAAAAAAALTEERRKRKVLSKRLNSTESVTSKEIVRIKKQSKLQEAELEMTQRKYEAASEEGRLFQEAIGRLLHSLNEERASTVTEEEEGGGGEALDNMFTLGICSA